MTIVRHCFQPMLTGVLLVALLCAPQVLVAQPPKPPQAEAPPTGPQTLEVYVEAFQHRQRLEIEVPLLEAASQQPIEAETILRDLAKLKPEVRQTLLNLLQRNYEPYFEGVAGLERASRINLEEQRTRWRSLLDARIKTEQQAFEADNAGWSTWLSLLNADNAALWTAVAVAFGTLLLLFYVDRRHQYRRQYWVRRGKYVESFAIGVGLFVLLAAPAIVTAVFGNRIAASMLERFSSEASPEAKLRQTLLLWKQEADQQGWENRLTTLAKELKGKTTIHPEDPPVSRELAEQLAVARTRLRECLVLLQLAERVTNQMQLDQQRLESAQTDLAARQETLAAARARQRLVGGLLGLALGLAYGGGVWLFLRGMHRRQQQVQATCPKCLALGTLKTETSQGGTDRLGVAHLRCVNVVNQHPYQECGFAFPEAYTDFEKLRFSTLGWGSSGKTFWMAMTYRELNKGRKPSDVDFERIRSHGAELFDNHINRILNERLQLEPTQTAAIPEPVLYRFRDRDPLGASEIIVSLFDYAGYVTSDEAHFHRRRALESQGFCFFLDPTYPSDDQARALVNFREDLRLIKDLKTGQRIDRPVALCVSKLDLLSTMGYARDSDLVPKFLQRLEEIDAKHPGMSLAAIEQRSQLVSELRDTIWPGWEIEDQVEGLFGPRFMFFPMTPVGLNELGETDLRRRTISPYLILEPLLWLMHMNGYKVLK